MALHQVLASQAQPPNSVSGFERHYSPISIWGDHFLSYASTCVYASQEVCAKLEQRVQELKEEVNTMLKATVNQPVSHILNTINSIQRLGLSYHFENEIGTILKQVHEKSYGSQDQETDGDLYNTALRFRLLRQQGYNVSCDVFNKFTKCNGTFKEPLTSDVVGLLSLYEAAHLRVHGEDILEEALTFTRIHLESAGSHQLSSHLSKQVKHALYQPLWKGVQRIEAKHYICIYEEFEDDSHNQTLLTLAKLDFNLVQKVYQKELSDMTRWWKELNFAKKLPFARDRLVEAYFWALETCFEPEYDFARMILCKYVALTTTINDLYDVHGTYEDLGLFTEAVERWDTCAGDQLPECMKVCYEGLLDSYSGFEDQLANQGNSYLIYYAREGIKILLRGYFQRVKWLKEKYTPTMDEYFRNELITSFYTMAMTSFVGMGGLVTKHLMDWMLNHPKIVKATSLATRLLNDLAGYKFERDLGQKASSVECYMNQYGVTEEEAKMELTKQIEAAWKDINQEWLHLHSNSTIPKPLLQIILNLARSGEVLYKNDEDWYTRRNPA